MANIWKNSVLTYKGIALNAKLLNGGTLAITSIKTGSGSVDVSDLASQTSVSDIKQTCSVMSITTKGNTTTIPVLLTNDGLATGYNLMQIGFYATDPDEGEILYAIAQASTGKAIPAESEIEFYSCQFNFSFTFSNDLNLTVNIDPAGLVTFSSLETYLSTKADKDNTVVTGSFSQNRKSGITIGALSHASGSETTASGIGSNASGMDTTASGDASNASGSITHASGYSSNASGTGTTASGYASNASGNCTTASGRGSNASGTGTTASGNESRSEGYYTTASGDCSHAEGRYTEALDYQHVQGHYNDKNNGPAGSSSGTSGTAFVIGNGTDSAASNAFRVNYDGSVYGKKAYSSTGADMAELREWMDGNPYNEDRRGYFVTMNGMNIKIASPGDYICGIISSHPCLIGNGDESWMGRYLLDEFGAFLYETSEKENPETGEKELIIFHKTNPEYDPSKQYVQRIDRPEWDYVGLCGVIHVRDDGTCEVNGFCKCGDGGIATRSERGYRVLERVNDHIVKVLFYLTGEIF